VLTIRLSDRHPGSAAAVLAVPVDSAATVPADVPIPADLRTELDAFIRDAAFTGQSSAIESLPRPTATPRRVLLVGVGTGDEAGWRQAGAALARAARTEDALAVAMPAGAPIEAIRGLAEGAWLASYTFCLASRPESAANDRDGKLRRITLLVGEATAAAEAALATAATAANATRLARDLTNMPSQEKTPEWFADQVMRVAAGRPGLSVRVLSGEELAAAGFGGLVAVGGGSTRKPRLVELAWAPPEATRHIALIGKGITFDTGGICIKPVEGMKLMRKDMGGAAAVVAATFGAAEMRLPIRLTTLAPLAENMASGSAFRPGDVVRHYGGKTSEVRNTDAEGRVVLADALAYADEVVRPDVVVDVATLTGANAVALGKRTAALYSENDALAAALRAAATAAGEHMWRMPLPDDYVRDIAGELADVANGSNAGAGSVMAALFLREFTGASRSVWAHLDMSAPAWADEADGELTKGATGWGVRTLLRWLSTYD
jgi:leucyl aminopeptidase